MTLEHTKQSSGNTSSMLTECPLDDCDATFGANEGWNRRLHYLNDHDPEDFGL